MDLYDLRQEEKDARNRTSRSGTHPSHSTPYSGRARNSIPVKPFKEIMDEELAHEYEKENKVNITFIHINMRRKTR